MPYRTVEDKIDGVVVTFVDIGERRRAEDALRETDAQMRILIAELQHRSRNLIGVVMAIVNRGAVASQTAEEFKASLGDRLIALARVQGLLSRGPPGDGVAFNDLLESELSTQSGQDGGAVTLDGPKGVMVRSVSVQALAMALHELMTNAMKYGAEPEERTPQHPLVGGSRKWLALDQCRLEGKRRGFGALAGRKNDRRRWAAPHRRGPALSVRGAHNLCDRSGRRPLDDRAAPL
jgi:HWE histidine kinase